MIQIVIIQGNIYTNAIKVRLFANIENHEIVNGMYSNFVNIMSFCDIDGQIPSVKMYILCFN